MTVCIYILNKYLCSKNLIIHETQFKSSNHLLFSGFFFRISSNTGAAPVISPSAVPYTNTLWVPPPSKFDISCTLMYLRLLTVQYQCKLASLSNLLDRVLSVSLIGFQFLPFLSLFLSAPDQLHLMTDQGRLRHRILK